MRQGERLQVQARAHQEQFSSGNVKRQGASQVEGCRQGRSTSYCKEGHCDACDSPEAIGSCGKGQLKKDVDQVEPDEAETVYHEHDDDAMSESSRWSGESKIPEKMVWFKEVLDVDENGEITYLEDSGNEKGNGTVMRTMRMSLISTCMSTRRSSRAVIIENYQPIKSNDH